MATGNNPALSREIARRTVRCRMDAGVDHPELRTGFHHDLPAWAYEHRADLVWAILVVTQSWLANDRPDWSGTPLGSLESWCRTMGGIFENVGLYGFLDNLEDFQAASDEESALWTEFFARWWNTYNEREVTVTAVFDIGRESLDLGHGTTRAQQTTLGRLLAGQRDRRYVVPDLGEIRVVRRNVVQGHRRWKLERKRR